MRKIILLLMPVVIFLVILSFKNAGSEEHSWIRINQLGYLPQGIKVAVYCSKDSRAIETWQLVDAKTKKIVSSGNPGKAFGAYGPFTQTYRLDFSAFTKPGKYYLQTAGIKSPEFTIGNDVYKGSADFVLRYMRQQRSGFNPFLKDSCHTRDGYTLYGAKAGLPDSSYVDVAGGWHDASDYLQYSSTSANATYNLLLAFRDFPGIFSDDHLANGLEGKNNIPDIADEANWGLEWLLKMFPSPKVMFNQIADDRDHINMRMPALDSQYGRGYQRPVYFISGEPQQRGKFLNASTGTSSTAAKFASAFALAHYLKLGHDYKIFYNKAMDALSFANQKHGFTQTASVRSPYIYAEENWVDDMELAYANVHSMQQVTNSNAANGWYLGMAVIYAGKEKITPWLGADTANHYQWYPFVNAGHYEILKHLKTGKAFPKRSTGFNPSFVINFKDSIEAIKQYYRQGIEKVWNKAKTNAFYRGVPFIWCSNNLTVAFAQQCYWYRKETGDINFAQLEQANIDWLFGCNPWGTSMVYGLPAWGDTPADPHSAFTHLKNYPIDGGLVDGPVYTSIYNNLIGIKLYKPDAYAAFQSGLAVYHDDYGDYSTNEPTMDGTASLIYLLAAQEAAALPAKK
ncbi:MAG: glycoside hydrolase family 9 protein [Ferruginibacter sp.]